MAAKTKEELLSQVEEFKNNSVVLIKDPTNLFKDYLDSVINVGVGANISESVAAGTQAVLPFVMRSPEIDYKEVGDIEIFRIPPQHKFLINSVEFLCTSEVVLTPDSILPEISIGHTEDTDAIVQEQPVPHYQIGCRFIVGATNTIEGNKTLTVSVITPSTLDGNHEGLAIVQGYLI